MGFLPVKENKFKGEKKIPILRARKNREAHFLSSGL
jgi:hypothetical protein